MKAHAHKLILFVSLSIMGLACGGEGTVGDGGAGPTKEELGEFNQFEAIEQDGEGNYIDVDGRTCSDPTPCGNCDHDCRASGNPYRQPGEPFNPQTDVCLDLEILLTEAIPTVVMLIDQSGSMDQNFGGVNRLDATYGALMEPVDGLVSSLQDRYRFGMALYTSFDGGPTCPNIRDVKPEFNNYETINRVFQPAKPEDETPTGEAILGIMRMFEEDDVRGPKVILLATDGEPDTCAQPNPQNGQGEAVEAANQAFARGVETVVLSVGEEVSEGHLRDMADAGAGMPRGSGTPFFKANDPDALKANLENIIVGTRECVFQIEGGILDPQLAPEGRVAINGGELQYGEEGWKFHQDEAFCFGSKQCLELTGSACRVIQHGTAKVEANFPCVYGDPDGDNGYGSKYPPGNPATGIPGIGSGDINNGTGNPADVNNGTGNPGTTGQCISPGGSCDYDGDCCSGLCARNGARGVCDLQ